MTEQELVSEKDTLSERFAAVRREIARAQAESPYHQAVTLLAATKHVDAARIRRAVLEEGLTDLGENRVQELLEKYDAIRDLPVRIHFIGSLQTNKVKYIADKVCMIHSLDSLKLAAEIDRQMLRLGRKMDVLVEVNIGEESAKGGVLPKDLPAFLAALAPFSQLHVRGLMTMAPKCGESAEYEKFFSKTYRIFLDNFINTIHNIDSMDDSAPILSMGMSDSYREAIRAGAGLVRVGTALFGTRTYAIPPTVQAEAENASEGNADHNQAKNDVKISEVNKNGFERSF